MLPIIITEFTDAKVSMLIPNLNTATGVKNADGSWTATVYRDGIGIVSPAADRARAVDFMCAQLLA